MSQVETKEQWKPGDWVLITHKTAPLMVIGRVRQVGPYCDLAVGPEQHAYLGYGPAIAVETMWAVDPEQFDWSTPGVWPLSGVNLRYEKLGAGEATAAP